MTRVRRRCWAGRRCPTRCWRGCSGRPGRLPLAHLGALELVSGFAAVFLAAIAAAVVTADGAAVFFGAAGAALLGVAGAALDYGFAGVGPAGAAAVMAALALALTPLIPAAAFRLAGLTLPPVPRDADELRRDTLTVQGGQVLERTAAADRVVTGAVSGIGLVAAVAGMALALSHGWLPRLTCGVLGCVLLLRARVFRGRAQRLWLQVPGYLALFLLAVGAAWHGAALRNVGLIVPLLVAGRGHSRRGRDVAARAPGLTVLGPGRGDPRPGAGHQPHPARARRDRAVRLRPRAVWLRRPRPCRRAGTCSRPTG